MSSLPSLLLSLALSSTPAGEAAPAEATSSPPARWHVAVEADPSPYLARGWSVLLGVRPAQLPEWNLMVAAFSAEFPEALVNLTPANQGWNVRVPFAIGLAPQRRFSSAERGGFFAGPLVILQQLDFTRDEVAGSASALRLIAGVHGGYQWFPFDPIGLYLKPWVGVAGNVALSGEPRIGDQVYTESPVSPSFAIHLGYEF